MNKSKLKVSIVICTYNGAKTIGKCLSAISEQLSSGFSYEVIVVNDGSTDNTEYIAKQFNVKLVGFERNLGISAARNLGVATANGSIVVFTDDDCVPAVNWLLEIIAPYNDETVVGVGGFTVPYKSRSITEKYMFESGYGNPAPIEFGLRSSPFKRLLVYIKDMIHPVTFNENIIRVQDIYTLNASFLKSVLNSVGGFDINLHSSEDCDICFRINALHPDKKLVFNKKAIIYHKYRSSFLEYLAQLLTRSHDTYKFYFKVKKIPPVFPFPFAILIILSVLFFIHKWNFVFSIVLPQLFYAWWGIKFYKFKKSYMLLFPYMQFLSELTSNIGIFRGIIISKFKGVHET